MFTFYLTMNRMTDASADERVAEETLVIAYNVNSITGFNQ
jgi:hypothetical protein